MSELSEGHARYVVEALQDMPLAVKAEAHKFIADSLRPIPRVTYADIDRAIASARLRYAEGACHG